MSQATVKQPAGSPPRTVDLDTSRWAVVIPSFNHADDAINCLASLREADARPGHVVFVDDASTDDAVGTIAAWADKARVAYQVVDPAELGTRVNPAG